MYIVTLVLANVVIAIIVAITLKQMGYWGSNKMSNKLQKDVKKEQSNFRQKKMVANVISKFEWLANNYGFIDTYELQQYEQYIRRLDLRIPVLKVPFTAKQLKGIFKGFNLLGLFILVTGLAVTQSIFSLAALLLVFADKVFSTAAKFLISDRDKKIEDNFPALYFSLYPTLIKGDEVRLTKPLRQFLIARNNPRGRKEMKHLLIFVEDYLKLIELYNDDLRALKELRNRYSFVTFVNFANIAAQALDGVDNRSKLLNFRVELQRKNRERVEANAKKKIQYGTWATYLIFGIFIQFIIIMLYLKFAIMQGM